MKIKGVKPPKQYSIRLQPKRSKDANGGVVNYENFTKEMSKLPLKRIKGM